MLGSACTPGVHPFPWPLKSSTAPQVGGTHSTAFPEKAKGQGGWRAGHVVVCVCTHWHTCVQVQAHAGAETALILVLTWLPQQTRKRMFGPRAAEEEAGVWEVG